MNPWQQIIDWYRARGFFNAAADMTEICKHREPGELWAELSRAAPPITQRQ